MALKKPLVLNGGQIEQLQTGDTLDASCSEVDVVTMTNGEAESLVIGAPVYVQAAGTVKKAKADASGTVQVLGLVKSTSIDPSGSGSIQTDGVLTAATDQWDAVTGGSGGLTAGSVYYLSPTAAGQLTTTAPGTAGQFVVRIGMALNATELDISVFAPMKL
ncbi:MAG: hypothetical protein PHR35_20425 [Kiritimatiellae bacterium]|nr:hypothetical protein [Kiritimatiellia bacterium]